MSREWQGLADDEDLGFLVLNGNRFECHACGESPMRRRRVLLNTRGFSFFNVEWLNRAALCYECVECGYLHWFATPDSREIDDDFWGRRIAGLEDR